MQTINQYCCTLHTCWKLYQRAEDWKSKWVWRQRLRSTEELQLPAWWVQFCIRTVLISGLPCTRQTWTYWSESSQGSWRLLRNWSTSNMRRGWDSWVSSLQNRRLRGGLNNAYKYLMGRKEDELARLPSVVPSDRTRNNGHKLYHMKVKLNTRRLFLLWGRSNTGTGRPEKLSLHLWRYANPNWTQSWATVSRWPCFSRGVGLDDLKTSLLTSAILWFHDSKPIFSCCLNLALFSHVCLHLVNLRVLLLPGLLAVLPVEC